MKTLFTLLCSTMLAHLALAQNWEEIGAAINFGNVVALNEDGNRMAIGKWSAQSPGGQINVYEKNQNKWVRIGDSIVGKGKHDYAGFSVALSNKGNTLVFGAPYDQAFNNYGDVRVFEFNGSTWVQKGKDITGTKKEDKLGWEVAISGNGNMVAASGTGDGAGLVRVFEWKNGEWQQVGQEFRGSVGWDENNPYLGNSIALSESGETIIIGEYHKDVGFNGWKHGQVHVYHLQAGVWVKKGSTFTGSKSEAHLGNAVAMDASGDIIAMAEPGNSDGVNGAGAVHVYKWKNSRWEKIGESLTDTLESAYIGEGNRGKGIALSGNGEILAIGKRYYPHNGTSVVGLVQTFQWNFNKWSQLGQNHFGNAYGDYYGECVALSGDGLTLAATSRSDPKRTGKSEIQTFQITQSVSVHAASVNRLQVFPNPAYQTLNVAAKSRGSLRVTGLDGREVLRTKPPIAGTSQIDISGLAPGSYILHFTGEKGVSTTKFMKK